MYDIIIQSIGGIGLLCAVIAFQCKKHKNVMLFRTLNEMFFAIQYLCLASYTGVAMNLIGSVRNIIFAINEIPHPGEKRLLSIVEKSCEKLPVDFESNIKKLFDSISKCDISILSNIDNIVKQLEVILKDEKLIS